MKCSRCAAELPESSTFCSRCGAANLSGQITTSGYSYLPAGAPPWPASVPARSRYGGDAPAPVQAAPLLSTEKSGRSIGRTIISGVLILLIPLVIGVGSTLGVLASQGRLSPGAASTKKVVVVRNQATPATAPGNQLPAPASFKLTTVKDVNVALEYPSSWVQDALQKLNDGVLLDIHPPQGQQISVSFSLERYSTSSSASFSSADQINQLNMQEFSQISGVTNLQMLPANGSPPTIGGSNWAEQNFSLVNGNGVKIDLISMAVEHNKTYYNILVSASDVYYTQAMQKYIQHMLTTFKFLS
ncbi:MAG: zinc ribbon domain-containing protein [Ktedonobacteraceae bacterium]|nr:zinc ribbon domain-containing protein [Ktedonobacteraceae bacterium]